MAYVVMNVLTVPAGRGETLEQRFAGRAGLVEQAEGFEHFELLRPVEGTQDYLVYTRWRSREDFEAWHSSQAFGRGHGRAPSGEGEGAGDEGGGEAPADGPAATGSSIWAFDVAQSASAAPEVG